MMVNREAKISAGEQRSPVEEDVAPLRVLAEGMQTQLNAIRRRLRQPLETEFARGNLTAPQSLVMSVLVRSEGVSLRQLSRELGLAHSTVSGIVDRLELRGLVERQVSPSDRRVTQIRASGAVREFMATRSAELTLHPLLEALGRASPRQRRTIGKGIATLAQLLLEPLPMGQLG